MVRPIEITDALSKSEAVQRLQQNQKVQPEAVQQFQKTLTGKLTERTTTPNPVPQGDQVVLHVDEQEKEKRKTAEDEQPSAGENTDEESPGQEKEDQDENPHPDDHIDIKV